MTGQPLLEARNLRKEFPAHRLSPWHKRRTVLAVDGVSFTVNFQETVSLVGESGSGKTTTARMVLDLERPTAGSILFRGQDVREGAKNFKREYRRSVQAVSQDPWGSLDPRMRVGTIVAEPLTYSTDLSRAEIEERVGAALVEVGLQATHTTQFPHEFSGGQRQRISLARALTLNPAVVVLDEPVSALDVSIRAQIMNLLSDLQERRKLSYLLIAHNLATVGYLSHRTAVMYFGRIVEYGDTEEVFSNPLHPYTQQLLEAALPLHPRDRRDLVRIRGEMPSPLDPPSGCAFHPRCPAAMDVCLTITPSLNQVSPGRHAACHLHTTTEANAN